jgi:hypothetical protein
MEGRRRHRIDRTVMRLEGESDRIRELVIIHFIQGCGLRKMAV